MFNVHDLLPYFSRSIEASAFIVILEKYCKPHFKNVVVSGSNRHGSHDALVSMKHFYIDEAIATFEKIINEDSRGFVRSSRIKKLSILKKIKGTKIIKT